MEIPCVATYVGGIPQLIQNEVDGLLVAPSDVDALTCAIERLIGRLGRGGGRNPKAA